MSNVFAFQPVAGQTSWCEPKWDGLPYADLSQPPPGVLVERNLLTRRQCLGLIQTFDRCAALHSEKGNSHDWSGRYIADAKLPETEIDTLRVAMQLRHLTTLRILKELAPPYFVFSDTSQLERWEVGDAMTPHAGNIQPDGSPGFAPHRAYSSVLFLNDDYAGGETYFPGLGARIRPEAGTLLVFDAGPGHVHGVSPVTRGVRYMYAGGFTHHVSMEAPLARQIV